MENWGDGLGKTSIANPWRAEGIDRSRLRESAMIKNARGGEGCKGAAQAMPSEEYRTIQRAHGLLDLGPEGIELQFESSMDTAGSLPRHRHDLGIRQQVTQPKSPAEYEACAGAFCVKETIELCCRRSSAAERAPSRCSGLEDLVASSASVRFPCSINQPGELREPKGVRLREGVGRGRVEIGESRNLKEILRMTGIEEIFGEGAELHGRGVLETEIIPASKDGENRESYTSGPTTGRSAFDP
jgi:hypothetical protein